MLRYVGFGVGDLIFGILEYALRVTLGMIIGLILGLTIIRIFLSEFFVISEMLIKVTIFLMKLFLAFL